MHSILIFVPHDINWAAHCCNITALAYALGLGTSVEDIFNVVQLHVVGFKGKRDGGFSSLAMQQSARQAAAVAAPPHSQRSRLSKPDVGALPRFRGTSSPAG